MALTLAAWHSPVLRFESHDDIGSIKENACALPAIHRAWLATAV